MPMRLSRQKKTQKTRQSLSGMNDANKCSNNIELDKLVKGNFADF